MAIQAPAKKEYCPNFLKALDAVAHDPRTGTISPDFRPPWTFLDSVAGVREPCFNRRGSAVPFAADRGDNEHCMRPDEVMKIFESGAAAGYLNQEFYAAPLDAAYTRTFRDIVKTSFQRAGERCGTGGIDIQQDLPGRNETIRSEQAWLRKIV